MRLNKKDIYEQLRQILNGFKYVNEKELIFFFIVKYIINIVASLYVSPNWFQINQQKQNKTKYVKMEN